MLRGVHVKGLLKCRLTFNKLIPAQNTRDGPIDSLAPRTSSIRAGRFGNVWFDPRSVLLAFACVFVPSAGNAFDYENLVALIEERELTSLEQVIEHLPEEYRAGYTLAFDSRSLHGASLAHPRVIMFGDSARFILTFNGEPDQHKYHEIEVMQYREDSKAFEMHSISFEDGVHFSEKNPEVCLSCHGRAPRPIWSSYEYSPLEDVEHWPGIYGSIHDAPVLNPTEKEAYIRFRAKASKHARYRFLKLDHPETEWFPFGVGPNTHKFRPNNRLGNLLARLNAQRVAAGLVQNRFFRRYPNAVLLWMLQCPEAEQEAYMDFIKWSYDQQYAALSHIALDRYGSNSIEQFAFVLEKLVSGLDVYTWNLSMEPAPDDARFFTGIVTIDELVAAAVLESLPDDHWLKAYYRPWTQQQLYDTFFDGYYAANVAPGGVGAAYEKIGPFYDRDYARNACGRLAEYTQEETASDS